MLDPCSLVASIRANSQWMDICFGDSILRQKIREGLKLERKHNLKVVIDPRTTVQTSRLGNTERMFSRNMRKTVVQKRSRIQIEPIPAIKRKIKYRKLWSNTKFIHLFSVIAASCCRMVPLPTEIWALKFRMLDPCSLVASIRANPQWRDICFEDSILRQKIQEGLELERKHNLEVVIDPQTTVHTSRLGYTERMFSSNMRKTVVQKRSRIQIEPIPAKKKKIKYRKLWSNTKFIHLFSVIAAFCCRMVPLPTEIWALKFRMLDSCSLVASIRANPQWRDISV
ncbi:uncharacterized protein isoform X2 [Leptinotarsa decemlineata]|uniref:uncharacterized protein isoform X2 n=1 Tax=Leptinotarsa decemlineata TaxID=7539 RepID=UPI003D30937C